VALNSGKSKMQQRFQAKKDAILLKKIRGTGPKKSLRWIRNDEKRGLVERRRREKVIWERVSENEKKICTQRRKKTCKNYGPKTEWGQKRLAEYGL